MSSSPVSFVSIPDEPKRKLVHVDERYTCGDRYQGTVVVDKKGSKIKNGTGRYEFSNGSYYNGEWCEGVMQGKGSFWEATTGDRFDGIWKGGKRVCGTYYFHDGDLYIGGFDEETGHLKHGRAVVVEDIVPMDAVYQNDVVVRKAPFTRTHTPAVQQAASTERADVSQRERSADRRSQDSSRQLVAAKAILRARRLEVSGEMTLPLSRTQTRDFGLLQQGKTERLMHPRLQDARDAVRYHHR